MVGIMDPRSQGEEVLAARVPRTRYERYVSARRRRHRRDAWLAATAMVSALLALPLAQNAWHGPEVAAILLSPIGRWLLPVAARLHAVVAQEESHYGCIVFRLQRTRSGERHRLGYYATQLRSGEVRVTEPCAGERRCR